MRRKVEGIRRCGCRQNSRGAAYQARLFFSYTVIVSCTVTALQVGSPLEVFPFTFGSLFLRGFRSKSSTGNLLHAAETQARGGSAHFPRISSSARILLLLLVLGLQHNPKKKSSHILVHTS